MDEQFMNLSRRYMKTNCACFTPNTGRIDDILRMVDEYQVDGVIDCSLMFCRLDDTEKRAVAEALKEKNIPVLSLETDYTDTDAERLRTMNRRICGDVKQIMEDKNEHIRYYILFDNHTQGMMLHELLCDHDIPNRIAPAPHGRQMAKPPAEWRF